MQLSCKKGKTFYKKSITHNDSLIDAPLDHAEIRPGVLLKGELKTEPVEYLNVRNMTMFVIVDLDDYKRQRLRYSRLSMK